MPRSLKKGPYIDPKLLKKVAVAAESKKSKLLKHGHVDQLYLQVLWG